jgi:hypothetical protein
LIAKQALERPKGAYAIITMAPSLAWRVFLHAVAIDGQTGLSDDRKQVCERIDAQDRGKDRGKDRADAGLADADRYRPAPAWARKCRVVSAKNNWRMK